MGGSCDGQEKERPIHGPKQGSVDRFHRIQSTFDYSRLNCAVPMRKLGQIAATDVECGPLRRAGLGLAPLKGGGHVGKPCGIIQEIIGIGQGSSLPALSRSWAAHSLYALQTVGSNLRIEVWLWGEWHHPALWSLGEVLAYASCIEALMSACKAHMYEMKSP
jgi:hypothetical protein